MELKKLILKNFKGIKDRTIEFNQQTTIKGANRSGKTRTYDSLLWLLIDVDSEMNPGTGKGSMVKPYDLKNNLIHNLETSVEGHFINQGNELILKKTLKEIWSEKGTYKNETVYCIDNVDLKKSDYEKNINNICDKSLLKILLLPDLFFRMSVSDKRNFITSLVEMNEPDKTPWLETQLKSKDIDTLKKSINASIKKTKEEIASNLNRIDENNSMIQTFDVDKVKAEIKNCEEKVKYYQGKLSSVKEDEKSKNQNFLAAQIELQKIRKEKYAIQDVFDNEQRDFFSRKRGKLEELKNQIKSLDLEKIKLPAIINNLEVDIDGLKKEREAIKIKAIEIQKQHIDEYNIYCPTCKREYEQEQAEKIKKQFNLDKVGRIEELKKESLDFKTQIEENTIDIAKALEDIEKVDAEIKTLHDEIKKVESFNFTKTIDTSELDTKIEELEKIEAIEIDSSELMAKLNAQSEKLKPLITELSKESENEKYKLRIEGLQSENEKDQSLILKLKGQLFEADEYVKNLMTTTENKVNEMFDFIKVVMFETLLNGSVNDVCEITANGVPYTALNTESKTNAKIDICNAISKKYNVQFPLFLDNRESVGKIIDTDLQVVNLYHVEDAEFDVQ